MHRDEHMTILYCTILNLRYSWGDAKLDENENENLTRTNPQKIY